MILHGRTGKKYRDTGLAAYLTRWLPPETLANGAMSGSFFETYVISEILKSYSNRGLDYRYFVSYFPCLPSIASLRESYTMA